LPPELGFHLLVFIAGLLEVGLDPDQVGIVEWNGALVQFRQSPELRRGVVDLARGLAESSWQRRRWPAASSPTAWARSTAARDDAERTSPPS